MRIQKIVQCLAAAASVVVAAPTLYLAGDSTMAKGGGGSNTQGWGVPLPDYLSLDIENDAVGGRSARSFTRELRFDGIHRKLKPGDFVVIEFGHNDGGSLRQDNGRTDCNPVDGNFSVTCQTVFEGKPETVLTFYTYIVNAVKLFKDAGANVIVSSQTPNNFFKGGNGTYVPSRFVDFAKQAAAGSGATYIDHGKYVAEAFLKLGSQTVNSYFPNDNTHTSLEGAKVVAKAFITGLSESSSPLKNYIVG